MCHLDDRWVRFLHRLTATYDEAVIIDPASKLTMQVRLVMAVYRAEAGRSDARSRLNRPERMASVVDRSLRILAHVETELDGPAASHPEVGEAIQVARLELGQRRT